MFDEFFGLTGRPFQLTPDPGFYFESATHRKALSYLGYGLAQGEGFIVITGEVGAGKSTLVAHLMATIDPNRLTAAQIVTSKLGGEELVHVVAQAFGLHIDGHDKASALGAIEAFLHEEARAGRRCLLIVDESQNLSIEALEELRMFSNFQLGAHPLLQTLLLGQPEFRDTLNAHPGLEQLRQRVIATHHLEAMEPGEIQPYVEHRLALVGWTGNPLIDSRVYPALYEASAGVPRRINQIANRVLLLAAVEQRREIDTAMLGQVVDELQGDAAQGVAAQVGKRPVEAPLAFTSLTHFDEPEFHPEPVQAVPAPADSEILAQMQTALAERDAQIAELQQAVIELANGHHQAPAADGGEEIAVLTERLVALENKLSEQDRTIRHTLTMLIEWIEGDGSHRAAA
jgi:putative secretion ATPase (PEP-CTERM system associated)